MVASHDSLGPKVSYFPPGNSAAEAKRAPPSSIDRSAVPLNMAPGVAYALSLILIVGHLQEGSGSLAKTFTFPEYPYKETTKNVSRPYNSSNSFCLERYVLNSDTGYGKQPSFQGWFLW